VRQGCGGRNSSARPAAELPQASKRLAGAVHVDEVADAGYDDDRLRRHPPTTTSQFKPSRTASATTSLASWGRPLGRSASPLVIQLQGMSVGHEHQHQLHQTSAVSNLETGAMPTWGFRLDARPRTGSVGGADAPGGADGAVGRSATGEACGRARGDRTRDRGPRRQATAVMQQRRTPGADLNGAAGRSATGEACGRARGDRARDRGPRRQAAAVMQQRRIPTRNGRLGG